MTRIVISGASGDLAKRITAQLLERMAPSDLTLVTRSPEKLADRAAQGVRVCQGDFRDKASLEVAYADADTLMMISSLDVAKRVPEHRNSIAAAKATGIRHIVYTSVAGIHPRNPTPSASDHIVTEADLHNSGLGFTIFRNQTYSEIFPTIAAAPALATGIWHQATGEGLLSPVSKYDIARCAVACLLAPEWHNGATYEITGPELLGFRDIVALTAQTYGKAIEYAPVTPEERFAQFDAMGVPRTYSDSNAIHEFSQNWTSEEMVAADMAYAGNFHAILTRHVEMITGIPPMPLSEVYVRCKGKAYYDC